MNETKYTKEQVAEKVKQIACDLTGAIPETVNAESKFVEDLLADSLDMIEIVMGVEDEFEIDIPDEDVENIKTVGQAIDYVAGKVGA
ncbi:MAG TPA: acyl carrier protein [Opitutales bacterium]|nr:acyl carrier protein [Opitutales bacterium]